MENWRNKLIEDFPDHRAEWEDENETIYSVFMELNAKCQAAHDHGDKTVLAKIYDFAAWCARQSEKDLWNAAGVSFYEHIIDHPAALREIPRWIPPDVFHQISPLLRWRMGDQDFEKLNVRYGEERLREAKKMRL